MRNFLLVAIAALSMWSCAQQDIENPSQEKTLKISLDIAKLSTRSIEGSAASVITADVKNAITSVELVLLNGSGTILDTYSYPDNGNEELTALKSNEGLLLCNVNPNVKSVIATVNVSTENDINNRQGTSDTPYTLTQMEYAGKGNVNTAGSGVHDSDGNAIWTVAVDVAPTMARFEVKGTAITNNSSGVIPDNVEATEDRTKVESYFSPLTIAAAEEAAKAQLKAVNNGTLPAPYTLTYSATFTPVPAFTINSIDAVYMNFFKNVKNSNSLITNANNGMGGWSDGANDLYSGTISHMWDTYVLGQDKVAAYNLFPQSVAPDADNETVKDGMPHVVLKLNTTEELVNRANTTRWISIRAFMTKKAGGNAGVGEGALLKSFDAGKYYLLDLADIVIKSYSGKLTVKASGNNKEVEVEEEEDGDPTDPNPEPKNVDLKVSLTIKDWIKVLLVPGLN